MVSSMQGTGAAYGMGMFPTAQTLSDEQKSTIQSILSQYDKDNLTADDAKSIFKAFREAGIQPGAGMKEAITAAGFDAEALRSMARPAGGPPPGGPRGGGQQSTASASDSKSLSATLQSLQDILSQYDLSNLSDDEESDLLTQLHGAGLLKSGNFIDLSA